MTKKDFYNLQVGDKATTRSFEVVDGKMVDVILKGSITRINSNRSQVFIRWDNGSENWYGRTGIELQTAKQQNT